MTKKELREKRKLLGITQAKFAEHLGIALITYQKLEGDNDYPIRKSVSNLINLTVEKLKK